MQQNSERGRGIYFHFFCLFQNFVVSLFRGPRSFYANRGSKMVEELKKLGILKSRINKTEEKLIKLSNYFSEKHGEPFLSFDRTVEALIKSNVSLEKVCI